MTDRKNADNNCLNELNGSQETQFQRDAESFTFNQNSFYLKKRKKNLSHTAMIDPKDGACCLNF